MNSEEAWWLTSWSAVENSADSKLRCELAHPVARERGHGHAVVSVHVETRLSDVSREGIEMIHIKLGAALRCVLSGPT